MPRIPDYNRQFTYASTQVPGPRLQGFDVHANAGMFGAESGRQLEKAGYLTRHGAAQIGHIRDDYTNRANTAENTSANTNTNSTRTAENTSTNARATVTMARDNSNNNNSNNNNNNNNDNNYTNNNSNNSNNYTNYNSNNSNNYTNYNDNYDATKARDAARQLQEGFMTWQSVAQTKQGEAGVFTVADYNKWVHQQTANLTHGLNNTQRSRFEELASQQQAAQRVWAEDYSQQQEQTYKQSTWQAEIRSATELLACNLQTPGLVNQALEQIKDATFSIGQHQGLDETGTTELMRSGVQKALAPAILARIQAGETGLANALLKQYAPHLGEAAAPLNAELGRERQRLQAEFNAQDALHKKEQRALTISNACRTLYTMPPEEAEKNAENPHWQASMGVTPDMAQDAVALLHTTRNWELETTKQNSRQHMIDLYSGVVNLALGQEGQPQNPVRAMEMIQADDTLDSTTRTEILDALQNNRINSQDDALLASDLATRIASSEGAVPDNELLQGVATGRLRLSSLKNLMDLREMAQSSNGAMTKKAFSALNNTFRRPLTATPTEQAAQAEGADQQTKQQTEGAGEQAKWQADQQTKQQTKWQTERAEALFAAQRQLQADMDAALKSGNRKELLAVTSPAHMLSIEQRFA